MKIKKKIIALLGITMVAGLCACKSNMDSGQEMGTDEQKKQFSWISDEHYGYIMSYSLKGNSSVADSLYLAYSNDGKTFTALNHGGSVYYTTAGEEHLDVPSVFRKDDGTFGIVAADNSTNQNVIIINSKDLITFDSEKVVKVAKYGNVGMPQCVYNDGKYTVLWTIGAAKFGASSDNLVTFEAAEKTDIEEVSFEGVTAPDNAQIGGIVGVTQEEYDNIVKAYSYEYVNYSDEKEYANPLIEQRADPYITFAEDGYYYFTASYPMYGDNDSKGYSKVVLRRAKTIEELSTAEEITIWDESKSDSVHRFIWAPEIHYIGGKWYVYFAGATDSKNLYSVVPQVLVCDSADPYTGTWTYKGRFQASEGDSFSFNGFSLDMTYFENAGKSYVIWAQKSPDSNLYMAEVDKNEPYKLTSKPITLSVPEYIWEKQVYNVDEGPSVLIANEKVYVTFSASGTGSEYCMGLLYADVNSNLMDKSSWTKVSTPLLTTEDLDGESGPGHNSFTVDENGNPILVYHARPASHDEGKCGSYNANSLVDPCRHARIKYVHFTNDGMMVLR